MNAHAHGAIRGVAKASGEINRGDDARESRAGRSGRWAVVDVIGVDKLKAREEVFI